MSKRSNFYQYYQKPTTLSGLLQKSSSAISHQQRYTFKGEAIVGAVILRCDLNGYSVWAKSKSLKERAQLLDDFFSSVFTDIDQYGGVYFRDEGDCLVAIFSSYFDTTFNSQNIDPLFKKIIGRTYGKDELTAKAIISCGQIAIFQKNHEVGTDDWSAEGEPFVFAARVEQAVESKKRIYYRKKDFEDYFKSGTSWAQPGGIYYWDVSNKSIQVTGLGKIAGWEEFSIHEHIPNGRIQPYV